MQITKLAYLIQKLTLSLTPIPMQSQRLFHGRGQCHPGLEQITVDWLEGQLLVTIFKLQSETFIKQLKIHLLDWAKNFNFSAILIQYRYAPMSPTEVLTGEIQSHPIMIENGLKYHLDLAKNKNMGLFLDMKNGRQWARDASRNKNVLNLFAYTCGFSVNAIAGGAKQVVNIDMARNMLNKGRENHRLNQLDTHKVKFFAHDIFKSWGKIKRFGPYDLVIIDPPSFQKGSFALTEDYHKILQRLSSLTTENSYLLASVNSPYVKCQFLLDKMDEYAPEFRFITRLENPKEFEEIDIDSGLKTLIFQKISH